MMLKLQFPNESHKEMYEEMIEEWSKEADFYDTSPGALFEGKDFANFLETTVIVSLGKDLQKTPSTLFLLIDNNKLIGGIDIRHNINSPILRDFGGHIGYGIRPSERKKGYATRMLQLGLTEAKKIGINRVLVSCHPDNVASEKVIIQNGGIYDKTAEYKSGVYNRYWITL